jgi:hypothetical protein
MNWFVELQQDLAHDRTELISCERCERGVDVVLDVFDGVPATLSARTYGRPVGHAFISTASSDRPTRA